MVNEIAFRCVYKVTAILSSKFKILNQAIAVLVIVNFVIVIVLVFNKSSLSLEWVRVLSSCIIKYDQ